MVKTKNFKKNLGKGLLAGALALSLAVPTFAAVDTVQDIVQEDALARESDPYVSYDLNLYSGVPAYTTGGSNTTNVALITMSNLSDSRAKNVEVYSCSIAGHRTVNEDNAVYISRGEAGKVNIPAAEYTSQNICASLEKYSYNGSIRVVGTYHYNHHVN